MIIRVAKSSSNNYVIINKEFINNEKLSFKAKGLLTYLLSLPNDWKIYEKELMKHSTDGRDSVRSAIKELIDNGYIKRERKRNEKGELKEYSYTVYERANTEDSTYVGFSNVGKTNVGKTNVGKPDTTNNNLTNNDLTNYLLDKEIYKENLKGEQQNEIALETKDNKITVSKEFETEFETIWEKYPKKQGKANASKAYIKARKKGVPIETIEIGLNNYLGYISREKIQTKYIKNGSTWFNQECWNDEYNTNKETTTKDIVQLFDFSEFK